MLKPIYGKQVAIMDTCIQRIEIMPPAPLQFEWIPCIQAKSTHKVPHTQERHSSRPFEIIHSDLSGINQYPHMVTHGII